MGLGGGRKVSRRGLIIIAALLFGIALSSRHTVDQNQVRSVAQQPNILAMLSKKPTSGQLRRSMARNTAALTNSGIAVAARNSAVAGKNLAAPSQLNSVHRAGTLDTDETWSSAKTYIIDSEIVVPNGVTLAIQPGTVIKVVGPGSGIHVQSGGRLVTSGTDEDPVYITSYRNDVIGGNTSTAMIRAGVGDYLAALTIDGGGYAVLANTRISYAEVGIVASGSLVANNLAIGWTNNAITSYGGEILASNALLSNNGTTMLVRGGDVIMRGVIKGYAERAIQACDWGGDQCSVDVSYVSWQDGTVSSVDAVCGQVLSDVSSMATSRNCSGTGGFPNLSMAATNLQSRIDAFKNECIAAAQDPCETLAAANNDLDVSAAGMPSALVSVPKDAPSGRIADWTDELEANTRAYIASKVNRTVEPFVFRDALRQVLDTLRATQSMFDSSAR